MAEKETKWPSRTLNGQAGHPFFVDCINTTLHHPAVTQPITERHSLIKRLAAQGAWLGSWIIPRAE